MVGDIHGRYDLLMEMISKVDQAVGGLHLVNPQMVFVGDYIDRGAQSASVLRRLYDLAHEYPGNVTCLLGNHEQMMLDFMTAPVARYSRWFRHGGVETMESYGLEVPEKDDWAAAASDLAQALRAKMGPEMESWLRGIPTMHVSGNLYVVHAGADPEKSMRKQSDRVLVWGHPEFLLRSRNDGCWVAHGHSVVDALRFGDSRISVDTGAYVNNRLSAALILSDGQVFSMCVPEEASAS